MAKKAVYPGTFDPPTYGHLDLIKRASRIFDEVIVVVAHSEDKNPLFSVGERVNMVKEVIGDIGNVKVDDCDYLIVDYLKKIDAKVLIRGLRMISDFEYEFQMALTNRQLNPEVETIFMMPHESYCYLSSKLIKETASLNADVSKFVPKKIALKLKEKLQK
jgi:pantetheine-phosphate adenylyltransferase